MMVPVTGDGRQQDVIISRSMSTDRHGDCLAMGLRLGQCLGEAGDYPEVWVLRPVGVFVARMSSAAGQ